MGLALGAGMAVVGSWTLARREDNRFDGWGHHWRRPRGTRFDRVAAATTDIGSVYGLLGSAIVLGATLAPRQGVNVAASGVIAWATAQAAKPLLRRPRPFESALGELLVFRPAGSSWPSGHTAVAAAVATSVANRGRSAVLTGLAITGWVGWSRIYVGAHHPSDIVAGCGIGVLSAMAWQAMAKTAVVGWQTRTADQRAGQTFRGRA